jgi:uncharacterized protein (TIGR02145 family)
MRILWITPITLLHLFFTSCKKDNEIYNKKLSNEIILGNSGSGTGNSKKYGTVKDIDGNIYKTIQIGTQIWMIQNLRVSRYNNGDSVKNILDNEDWRNATVGALCSIGNSSFLATVYGKLYNWFSINDPRGIAPKGWRVPTLTDYQILINYLGSSDYAGAALKEVSLLWTQPNVATNNSGFSARPAGIRDSYYGWFSAFYKLNESALFWTSSPVTPTDAFFMLLSYNTPVAELSNSSITTNGNMKTGASIRCIKN